MSREVSKLKVDTQAINFSDQMSFLSPGSLKPREIKTENSDMKGVISVSLLLANTPLSRGLLDNESHQATQLTSKEEEWKRYL